VQISSYLDFISSIDTCISSIVDTCNSLSLVKLFFSTSIVFIFSKRSLFSLAMTSFSLVAALHLLSTSSFSPCRTTTLECRPSILSFRPLFSADMSSELLHISSYFDVISSIDVCNSITFVSIVSFAFIKSFLSSSIVCIFSDKLLILLTISSFSTTQSLNLSSTSSFSPCNTPMLDSNALMFSLSTSFSLDVSSDLLQTSLLSFISSIDISNSAILASKHSFSFIKSIFSSSTFIIFSDRASFSSAATLHLTSISSFSLCNTAKFDSSSLMFAFSTSFSLDMRSELVQSSSFLDFISVIFTSNSAISFSDTSFSFIK